MNDGAWDTLRRTNDFSNPAAVEAAQAFLDVYSRIQRLSSAIGPGEWRVTDFVPFLGEMKDLLAAMIEKRRELQCVVSEETYERIFSETYEADLKNLIDLVEAGRFCATCGTRDGTLFRCSSCKTIRYCSKACQTAGWKRHKVACRASGAGLGAGPTPKALATPKAPVGST
jgi:hypothetical protein